MSFDSKVSKFGFIEAQNDPLNSKLKVESHE